MQLGKTRWRRFAVPMATSTVAVVGLGAMVTNGVLAASFAVSGQEFKVSADSLNGTGFAQFGSVDQEVNGTPHAIALSAIKTADLTNMCQSVVTPLPFGHAVLRITSSAPHADNLTVDTDDLAGDATFTNIDIGQDASTLTKGGPAHGQAGLFGQQADGVVINNLKQKAWATSAGTFQLNGLHLTVSLMENGATECF